MFKLINKQISVYIIVRTEKNKLSSGADAGTDAEDSKLRATRCDYTESINWSLYRLQEAYLRNCLGRNFQCECVIAYMEMSRGNNREKVTPLPPANAGWLQCKRESERRDFLFLYSPRALQGNTGGACVRFFFLKFFYMFIYVVSSFPSS